MQDKLPPQKSTVSRLLGISAILLAHFFTLVVLLFVFVKIVPTYISFFERAELQLPAATVFVVATSDAAVKYWYAIIPLAMMVDGAVVVFLSFLFSKRKWILSFYSHTWLLAVILLLLCVNIAIVMPLISLAQLDGPIVAPAP